MFDVASKIFLRVPTCSHRVPTTTWERNDPLDSAEIRLFFIMYEICSHCSHRFWHREVPPQKNPLRIRLVFPVRKNSIYPPLSAKTWEQWEQVGTPLILLVFLGGNKKPPGGNSGNILTAARRFSNRRCWFVPRLSAKIIFPGRPYRGLI